LPGFMRNLLQTSLLGLLLLLPASPLGGCATIAGTAVSPITGGVDLARRYMTTTEQHRGGKWWLCPFVFVGGAVAGPFVAIYNGVGHDTSIFKSWWRYWQDVDDVMRPFEMITDE